MSNSIKSIPVKSLAKEFDKGIAIGKFPLDISQLAEETEHSHRHDYHFFILQDKGRSHFEIDFKKYELDKPSVIYISPNQVHRVLETAKFEFYLLAISNENLNPEYHKLLQEISPAHPLSLSTKDFSVIKQSVLLCLTLFQKKEDILYLPALKDSCNAFIALVLSQYLENTQKIDAPSRFENITKAFKLALETSFVTDKRPADYAKKLNISVSYLNESVKNVTGLSVSHHILQRVVLEAKRLLYHSKKSVKEIASELGYKDYSYFSRLFNKSTGMSALSFRNRNHD